MTDVGEGVVGWLVGLLVGFLDGGFVTGTGDFVGSNDGTFVGKCSVVGIG